MVHLCKIAPKLLASLFQVCPHKAHHQAFTKVTNTLESVSLERVLATKDMTVLMLNYFLRSIVWRCERLLLFARLVSQKLGQYRRNHSVMV